MTTVAAGLSSCKSPLAWERVEQDGTQICQVEARGLCNGRDFWAAAEPQSNGEWWIYHTCTLGQYVKVDTEDAAKLASVNLAIRDFGERLAQLKALRHTLTQPERDLADLERIYQAAVRNSTSLSGMGERYDDHCRHKLHLLVAISKRRPLTDIERLDYDHCMRNVAAQEVARA